MQSPEGQAERRLLDYKMGQAFAMKISSQAPRPVEPIAVATWAFGEIAVKAAASLLKEGKPAIDAVEQGVNAVELDDQEQYYVGYGGFPNAEGKMELDAAIMDGHTRTYGAIAGFDGCPKAISVARAAMEKSEHNILVGEGANSFAKEQGFAYENVLSPEAHKAYIEWKKEKEQGVIHYAPGSDDPEAGQHDTIGLICRDTEGNIVAGTSTSGWKFKHAGRVGDSPLIGSGLYADATVGAAVATGDGEEIMRICLSFLVVEKMREGKPPEEACRLGIKRLKEVVLGPNSTRLSSFLISQRKAEEEEEDRKKLKMYERLTVAVLAMDRYGNIGASSTLGVHNPHRGRPAFPYVVWRQSKEEMEVEEADDRGTG